MTYHSPPPARPNNVIRLPIRTDENSDADFNALPFSSFAESSESAEVQLHFAGHTGLAPLPRHPDTDQIVALFGDGMNWLGSERHSQVLQRFGDFHQMKLAKHHPCWIRAQGRHCSSPGQCQYELSSPGFRNFSMWRRNTSPASYVVVSDLYPAQIRADEFNAWCQERNLVWERSPFPNPRYPDWAIAILIHSAKIPIETRDAKTVVRAVGRKFERNH